MGEYKPATWQDLRECLHELAGTNNVVCRGQGANHDEKLMSCLDRRLAYLNDDKEKSDIEREIARRFLRYAPNYLPFAEQMHLRDGPSFLMLMQHYGAPTRLVDWSESIWIGAYFAARSEPEKDGIIFAFNGTALDENVGRKHGHETPNVPSTGFEGLPTIMWNTYGPWVCRLMRRGHQIPRMIAQQGLFTVGGRLSLDHWKAIDEIIPDNAESPGKQIIVVPRDLKPEILKTLHQMGINGSTLFPGIDGVGKGLTEYAQYMCPLRKP